MLKKLCYGAVLAGVLLCVLLASPALAHGRHGHGGHHHWKHHHSRPHYRYLRYSRVPVYVHPRYRYRKAVVRSRIVVVPPTPRLIFRIH